MRKPIPGLLLAALFCLAPPALEATDPDGIAANDFGNNGDVAVPASVYAPGQKQRDSETYRRKTLAERRDYYERGGHQTNRDSACRARMAYRAARYQGPVSGYGENGRPRAGGGEYGEFPTDPADIVGNIYRFVDDMLYPRKSSDAEFHHDEAICQAIEKGLFDIGQPFYDPREGFACIVAAHFFTSLVRELGFPARELNVYYAVARNEFTTQTAAASVWYDGRWHFHDPWESFLSYESYLHGRGRVEARPNLYQDAWIWKRQDPPAILGGSGVLGLDYKFVLGHPLPSDGGWGDRPRLRLERDGTRLKVEFTQLRLGIKKDGEWYAGTRPSGESVFNPKGVIYLAHDDPVPNTRLEPPGPAAFGFELLTLLHDENEAPGEYAYTAVLSNPGEISESYELDIAAIPTRREVGIAAAEADLSGSLGAGESVEIPFVIELGAPLAQAPAAVGGIQGRMVDTDRVKLKWTPVADASAYRLYRSRSLVESLPDPAAELIAEVDSARAEIGIGADDYIGIVALGADGLESMLDPGTGSVFVLDPELVDGYPYASSKWLQGLLLILLLGAILAVAAYIARKA